MCHEQAPARVRSVRSRVCLIESYSLTGNHHSLLNAAKQAPGTSLDPQGPVAF
jgi:hypothetical protein